MFRERRMGSSSSGVVKTGLTKSLDSLMLDKGTMVPTLEL